MDELSFEKIDGSHTARNDATYVAALALLVAGVLLFFTAERGVIDAVGIGLIVVACLAYVRLLRTAPPLRYFRYLWLDQHGVHHIEGNSPANRTTHLAWHEIESAEASFDEFKGLVLTLRRAGMRGMPIYLAADDADQAVRAIRERISVEHLR